MYRQHAVQRFHTAGRAEQVSGHGFGGVNNDFARMIAQSAFDGFGFVGIAQRSRCTVCVDVINVFSRVFSRVPILPTPARQRLRQ